MRAPEADLIFYQRDVGVLVNLGLIDRDGGRLLLTRSGQRQLTDETTR